MLRFLHLVIETAQLLLRFAAMQHAGIHQFDIVEIAKQTTRLRLLTQAAPVLSRSARAAPDKFPY